jgi:hypothetical protein
MAVESDAIAIGVTGAYGADDYAAGRRPVVTLTGWVKAVDGEVTRIYSNARFTVWIEIPTDQIVHQIPGAERTHDDGRSVLWVVADATVTACRETTAAAVADATPDAPDTMRLAMFIWPPPKP